MRNRNPVKVLAFPFFISKLSVHDFVEFENNNESLHSKNDCEWNLIVCYVVNIKDNET